MIYDLARNWQLNFQDPASPLMEGLIDLHHNFNFILILIFGLVTSLGFIFFKSTITNKGYHKRFLYLFTIVKSSENSSASPINFGWEHVSFVICVGFLLYLFLKNKEFIFIKALQHKVTKNIICYICFRILWLRGLFEMDFKPLVYLIAFPGVFSAIDNLITLVPQIPFVPFVNEPLFIGYFYLMLGLDLILLDSIGQKISVSLHEDSQSSFSITLTAYLNLREKNNHYENILNKGIFTSMGKLSATGQGAIYAGAFACITGISVALVNNHYLLKRDEKKYSAAEKAREKKYSEYEKARQHDRDKWAHEEKTRQHERDKWKQEESKKNSSGWFSKK